MIPGLVNTYARMSRVFTAVFGETVVLTTPEGAQHIVDAVYSGEQRIEIIRDTSAQVRDYPLLSLRRDRLIEIFGPAADLVSEAQDCSFLVRGVEYSLDDVTDDGQMMLEGRLFLAAQEEGPAEFPRPPSRILG